MKKLTSAQKRRLKHIIFTVLSLCLMTSLIVILSAYLKGKKAVETDMEIKSDLIDYSAVEVIKPQIKKKLLTKNVNSRPGEKLEAVKGIVVHYTANPGTDAMANRNYFENRKDMPDEYEYKVSSHFIIGIDGEIIQCIPLSEIAYASNERNADTVSIECCHKDKTGKFSDATYKSLVKLCAWLCSKYKLQKDSIIRHFDVTGKQCPLYFVENEGAWSSLKDDIAAEIMSNKQKAIDS